MRIFFFFFVWFCIKFADLTRRRKIFHFFVASNCLKKLELKEDWAFWMYPSCVFVLGDLGCRKTTVFLWGRGRRILGSICRANEYNNIKAASLKSFKKGFQAAPEERVIFPDIQALVQPRVSYQSSPPPPPPPPPHVNSNLLGMNSFLS